MSATPLIQKIKKSGSTLYAFSSAISQEQLAANDDSINFSFSKYACLNIPDIKSPIFKKNNIQFLTIDGFITDPNIQTSNSINLIQSFQNYALNLETLLINQDNYDKNTLSTVAERVFFKWLKELGAIRFRESYENESVITSYVEEDDNNLNSIQYERVIKHIGDLDIINTVQSGGNNYTEVYVNIPSEVGTTPVILFKTFEDLNYKTNMVITGKDEYITNRNSNTIHPDGLSLISHYDYSTNIDYINSTNANWYNQDSINGHINSFFTEKNTFNNSNSEDVIKKYNDYIGSGAEPFSDIYYRKTRLDGITIDFNANNYTDIVEDNSISTIQEYNSYAKSRNFEFNAILIYYDIYNDNSKDDIRTNLYGILFLDDIIDEIDRSYIPRYQKYKQNQFTNQNGNSYGLKLSFRNSQSISNDVVSTSINEYNTFSMGVFTDTLISIQKILSEFEKSKILLNEYNNRINYLENLYYNLDSIESIKTDISNLYTKLENYNLSYDNQNVLLNLISNLNKKYQDIIDNKTSATILFDSNLVQQGSGIIVDKSIKDKLIIKNKNQAYNISQIKDVYDNVITESNPYNFNVDAPIINVFLKDFSNYVKIYNVEDTELITNMHINLNDKNIFFENGQLIKIKFNNKIIVNNKYINIYTDYYNRVGYGSLNKLIASIQLTEYKNPLIELICLDRDLLLFDYNIINS